MQGKQVFPTFVINYQRAMSRCSRNTNSIPHLPVLVKGVLKVFLKVVTVAGLKPASHGLKIRCIITLLHRVEIVKTPDSRPLVHSLSPEGDSSSKAQSFLIACPLLGIVIQFCFQRAISFWQPWFINHLWSRQRTQYITSLSCCKGGPEVFLKIFHCQQKWGDPS